MDFSYGFRAQVLGGLGPFFLLVLIPCFYVSVLFFFKRKTGPKKEPRGRDWLLYRPGLVFAREPSAIPSSNGVWEAGGSLGLWVGVSSMMVLLR